MNKFALDKLKNVASFLATFGFDMPKTQINGIGNELKEIINLEEESTTIDKDLLEKLNRLGIIPNETRDHNVGTSDYSTKIIQPWSVWIDWKLDPWDADIIKRIARHKKGDSRVLDYQKIIHICEEKIRQLEYQDVNKDNTEDQDS